MFFFLLSHSWHGRSFLPAILLFLPITLQPAGYSFAGRPAPEILPVPVLSSAFYPCIRCHPADREIVFKEAGIGHGKVDIQKHVGARYDCYTCHNRQDMDRLNLFDASPVGLDKSSILCGQCHNTSYQLWTTGLHGKRVGTWNGRNSIFPCTACHDPHQPGYPAHVPKPPPVPPEETLRW